MEQFAVAMGKKDNAIFLDTNNLKYRYIPAKFDNTKIVIGNTKKQRGLVDSKYNERRVECERAIEDIKTIKNINSLCELTNDEFEDVKHVIRNETCLKRVRHAVYENQRTIKAVEALENNELKLFGELLNQSHILLKNDYEVSGKELDTLVEAALHGHKKELLTRE